jgi:hypothetical protein
MLPPTPLHYILDAQGEPVPCDDVVAWGRWFDRSQRTGERIVAQSRDEGDVGDGVLVSTVFLGLDHNFKNAGPPVLWETLVMGGALDGKMDRYTSKAAAVAGHARICQLVNQTRA